VTIVVLGFAFDGSNFGNVCKFIGRAF
jgi:hypothetical protein